MSEPIHKQSKFYYFVERFGIVKSVLITTTLVSSLSILMTLLISIVVFKKPVAYGLLIGGLVPFLLGSPPLYFLFKGILKLEKTRDEQYEISMHDELTGSYNRRYFLQQLEYQLGSAVRYKTPFSTIMFDVDDFKKINDTYGHSIGDQLLRMLSTTCIQETRSSDIFARLGGDEFVFIAPGLNAQQVYQFAQRIQKAAVNIAVPCGKQEIHFTISIGCFTWSEEFTDTDSLLKQLDLAMYAAKNRGKNRVVHALDLMGGLVFPGIFAPENAEHPESYLLQ